MAREHGRTAQGMTRRSFLKGGSAFLGVAAGTAMLSGGVLGGCAPGEGGSGNSGGSQQAVTADGVRFTVYDTDLIIVGAGFSGAVSALECASQNKNAILIEKGPYGFGGGCGMNWDIVWRFQPNLKHDPTANFTLSNKTLMEKAAAADEHLPALLQVLNNGETAPRRNEDGTIKWYINSPSTLAIEGGFPRHQLDKAEESPFVAIHDRTMITDLVVSDGRCIGVMGIYLPTGEYRVYRAPATVVNAGAACWIVGHSTVSAQTLGSPDNTADVDMAAYRHGASIGDSEFGAFDLISIYPTGIAYGFNSGLGADASEYEYLLDKDFNRIFVEGDTTYDYDKFYADRTYFGRCVAKELAKGRGTERNGLYIDLSSKECQEKFRQAYRRSIDLRQKNFGIDVLAEPLEIGFEMYEHGGAPVIDENCMSVDIPGLFCARGSGVTGEYGGTMCYLNLRFGSYVVKQAIQWIDENGYPESADLSGVEAEIERLEDIRMRAGGQNLTPVEVRHRIQEAGESLQILRTKDELEAAAKELERIRKEDLPNMACRDATLPYNPDWKMAIENYNMLDIAEMSVKATLMREESRGQYLREDFPEPDDANWLCTIVANDEGGEMVLTTRPQETKVSWA